MPNAEAAVLDVRTHTELLLESIGIKRIVVVDDEYAAITVEDLIGLCSELEAENAARLPHVEGVAFASDQDIWAKQLREKWQDLSEEQQSEIIAQVRGLQAEGGADSGDVDPDASAAGGAAEPVTAKAVAAEPAAASPPAAAGVGPVAETAAQATVAVGDQRVSRRDDSRAAGALEDLLGGLSKCGFLTLSLAPMARTVEGPPR